MRPHVTQHVAVKCAASPATRFKGRWESDVDIRTVRPVVNWADVFQGACLRTARRLAVDAPIPMLTHAAGAYMRRPFNNDIGRAQRTQNSEMSAVSPMRITEHSDIIRSAGRVEARSPHP